MFEQLCALLRAHITIQACCKDFKYIYAVWLVLGECPTSLCRQTISLIVSVNENEKQPLKVTFYLYDDSLFFLLPFCESCGILVLFKMVKSNECSVPRSLHRILDINIWIHAFTGFARILGFLAFTGCHQKLPRSLLQEYECLLDYKCVCFCVHAQAFIFVWPSKGHTHSKACFSVMLDSLLSHTWTHFRGDSFSSKTLPLLFFPHFF